MVDRIMPDYSSAWIGGQKSGNPGAMVKPDKMNLHDICNFHDILDFA
jgi:hypothetical protein